MPKKSAKQKLIQIPNICPFKEDILKEVEADKQRREEEKIQNLENLKAFRMAEKKKSLETIAADALLRSEEHKEKVNNTDVSYFINTNVMGFFFNNMIDFRNMVTVKLKKTH